MPFLSDIKGFECSSEINEIYASGEMTSSLCRFTIPIL
jgi:hypothetical protein